MIEEFETNRTSFRGGLKIWNINMFKGMLSYRTAAPSYILPNGRKAFSDGDRDGDKDVQMEL